MTNTPSGILIHYVDQFGNSALAITHHVPGYALGDCDQFIVHHQHAVVHAFDEAFDQYASAAGIFTGHPVSGSDLVFVYQVDGHAAAMIGVEWFDDDRKADAASTPRSLAL